MPSSFWNAAFTFYASYIVLHFTRIIRQSYEPAQTFMRNNPNATIKLLLPFKTALKLVLTFFKKTATSTELLSLYVRNKSKL